MRYALNIKGHLPPVERKVPLFHRWYLRLSGQVRFQLREPLLQRLRQSVAELRIEDLDLGGFPLPVGFIDLE